MKKHYKQKHKMACRSCGAVPKQTPKLDTVKMPHPNGAITVLGRKVELVPEITVWECSTCHAVECVSIWFPLDPDASLIGEIFDLRDGEVSLEDVVDYLMDNNISAADLEELAKLKNKPANVDECLNWWTSRGLAPVVVVPEGQGSAPPLKKILERGITVEETADEPSKTKDRGPIRFLRPACGQEGSL